MEGSRGGGGGGEWSYSIIASERLTSTQKTHRWSQRFLQRFFYKFTLLPLGLGVRDGVERDLLLQVSVRFGAIQYPAQARAMQADVYLE